MLFDRSNLLALVIDVLFKHIVVDVQMLLARDVHHIEGKHCTMYTQHHQCQMPQLTRARHVRESEVNVDLQLFAGRDVH